METQIAYQLSDFFPVISGPIQNLVPRTKTNNMTGTKFFFSAHLFHACFRVPQNTLMVGRRFLYWPVSRDAQSNYGGFGGGKTAGPGEVQAGPVGRKEAKEGAGLFAPTSPNFESKNDQTTSTARNEFGVDLFLVAAGILQTNRHTEPANSSAMAS